MSNVFGEQLLSKLLVLIYLCFIVCLNKFFLLQFNYKCKLIGVAMRKELESLMDKLNKSIENGENQLSNVVFREVMMIFEGLKERLPLMSPEGRQDVLLLMHKFHAFLQEQVKKISVQAGLSEEQLLRFAENPDNFSPEQWSMLCQVKQEMQQQSNDLKEVMKGIQGPIVADPTAFLEQTRPAKKPAIGPAPARRVNRAKREVRKA